jgi:hypothetical protein
MISNNEIDLILFIWTCVYAIDASPLELGLITYNAYALFLQYEYFQGCIKDTSNVPHETIDAYAETIELLFVLRDKGTTVFKIG